MSQKKRADKNSVTAALIGFKGAMSGVPLPQGVDLRSDEEMVIWDQFTRARAREDWRDMDLLLLAKVVRMEADIRNYQAQIELQGAIVENQRGTQIPNPLLTIIDTVERRQLAVIRSMSLNQQASDPRTLNGSAKNVIGARSAVDNASDDDLIALPN
jgi:hypothetical protein|tara:strand:- start:385 stop:855 length:471 start_codon:yes stop_codon:yes gene_type:complete